MKTNLIPNTFQHHNFYVDELMHLLTPEENTVLTFAIREILGWEDTAYQRRAKIAQSVFARGKEINGVKVCHGTGLSSSTVAKCLRSLVAFHILERFEQRDAQGRLDPDGTEYGLELDRAKIDMRALELRREERAEALKAKNLNGIKAMLAKRGISPVQGNRTKNASEPVIVTQSRSSSCDNDARHSDTMERKPTETQETQEDAADAAPTVGSSTEPMEGYEYPTASEEIANDTTGEPSRSGASFPLPARREHSGEMPAIEVYPNAQGSYYCAPPVGCGKVHSVDGSSLSSCEKPYRLIPIYGGEIYPQFDRNQGFLCPQCHDRHKRSELIRDSFAPCGPPIAAGHSPSKKSFWFDSEVTRYLRGHSFWHGFKNETEMLDFRRDIVERYKSETIEEAIDWCIKKVPADRLIKAVSGYLKKHRVPDKASEADKLAFGPDLTQTEAYVLANAPVTQSAPPADEIAEGAGIGIAEAMAWGG